MNCSKCNRCLTDENGVDWIALQVKLNWQNPDTAVAKEQLGKYAPEGDELEINLCYECWLDSWFGVR